MSRALLRLAVLLVLSASSALVMACGGSANRSGTPAASGTPAPASPAPAPPGPVTVTTQAGAAAAIGKPVRVEGVAENAKLGAAVQSGDLVVYCLDRDRWPAEQDGHPIAVEGTLEQTHEFEAPTEGGVHAAGTGGPVFVLRRSALSRAAASVPPP